jgi:hypothetical protein
MPEPLRLFKYCRLAGEEVHPLHVEVFGQLELGGGAFVTIEAFDDLAVNETDLSGQLVELCLRQSAANSSRPQIDIAARG